MDSLDQRLYDQAVYDVTFHDINTPFAKYMEILRRKQKEKFLNNIGTYKASAKEKEALDDAIGAYITNVTDAHAAFLRGHGTVDRNGAINMDASAAEAFEIRLDDAVKSNKALYEFQQDMRIRAQYGMVEQAKVSEKHKKTTKGLLKGLALAGLVGAGVTATAWGVKKGIDKVSEMRDAREDRVTHVMDAGVRQGRAYDFTDVTVEESTTIVYAKDSKGQELRTRTVPQERPVIDVEDIEINEEVTQEEIIEEETIVRPGRVIQQPDTVIPGKVIHEPDTVIPGRVIQQPDTIIPGNVVQQPTVVAQPDVVVSQPNVVVGGGDTVVVADSGLSDAAAFAAGAMTGAIIGGHHMPPPMHHGMHPHMGMGRHMPHLTPGMMHPVRSGCGIRTTHDCTPAARHMTARPAHIQPDRTRHCAPQIRHHTPQVGTRAVVGHCAPKTRTVGHCAPKTHIQQHLRTGAGRGCGGVRAPAVHRPSAPRGGNMGNRGGRMGGGRGGRR